MKLQLVRNATIWLQYGSVHFLIDPMFSDVGANPPIINSTNDRRNPLVPLPFSLDRYLAPDAVLLTHLHPDHWDDVAAAALSKSIPILCQPEDDASISSAGFTSVTVVNTTVKFKGVTISRTRGQHGTGDIGELMGRVSGFVFQADGEPTLYIAGDTIWCDEVKQALDTYRPDVTVVNAGGARFAVGDPITMDTDDVDSLTQYAPYTKVIAVHMDTINHCLVTRTDLRNELEARGILGQVNIPEDGETCSWDSMSVHVNTPEGLSCK
ncbi:MBL fold metallo-hydrolase [Paenibacillus sp. N3.4]|uniref:MBL fold metallo-hydrolase n=1 Tax=Paenibacillus sp. N3.4 TaxID=2603222 RepID=UPI0011CC4B86|nr:MBL fold metallo-hydrolase [Paenibacillus sp. N3.4]TXK81840.1 MBL fold metallo-hydrolase [Paenibacillus sp. N3.4]